MLVRLILMDGFSTLASILVPLGLLLYARRQSRPSWMLLHLPHEGAEAWRSLAVLLRRRQRIGSAVVVGVLLLVWVTKWLPLNWVSISLADITLWTPLVPVGVATVCVATGLVVARRLPPATAGPARPGDVSPRTMWSFTRHWWVAVWITTSALLVLTLVGAGAISGQDETGRYSILKITVGSVSAGSQFLGWFYAVPILLVTASLALLTAIGLSATARPPLPAEAHARGIDTVLRELRSRGILALSTGAVLVTMGMAWTSIGLAARMRAFVPTDTLGQIDVGTTIGALATPLWAAGYLAEGVGIALLLLPLLGRAPRFVAARAPAAPVDEPLPQGVPA